jgi:hypothetical protein
VDNVAFNVNYTVDEWMAKIRLNLLLIKDNQDKVEEDEVSAAQTEECVLLEDTSDNESDHDESDITTETWSSESDGSVNEKCCYISSAANIRRCEMHGQKRGSCSKENEEETCKEDKKES